ncbi:haloacid dehalogenase [Bacillus sp. FJAT-27264]|uniref:HAD family hydrolase n=1 Tax=Paenibacillus sp. (strain DSM 101736 / FJAT-27264) TaxID=1850362 RepID=UPI000807D8FD|nr:HAD family hydrolase [Bacillus sp. FJAT-27264]OBZ11811.1 haloacid dehalogenase [Bacillus sp. FJAT-27264]
MPFLHVNHMTIPCQGILFDKDGTLLDILATWGLWAELVLRGMETQLAIRGKTLEGGISGLLGTIHDDNGKVVSYDPSGPLPMATEGETEGLLAWQLYASGLSWNEALAKVKHITKNAMNELRKRQVAYPLPGLLPFLKQCADASLKLGVVTSDGVKTTAEQLEWLGIAAYFQTVVTRDHVVNGKPDPEMAEKACRELGLNPGETVMIGDSNADMQTAKGAGVSLAIGIAGQDGGSAHLLDADIVISGFHELSISS